MSFGIGRGELGGDAFVGVCGMCGLLSITAVSNSGVTSQPSGVSSMNIPTSHGPDSLAHDGRGQGSMVATHLCVRARVPGACVKMQSSEPKACPWKGAPEPYPAACPSAFQTSFPDAGIFGNRSAFRNEPLLVLPCSVPNSRLLSCRMLTAWTCPWQASSLMF